MASRFLIGLSVAAVSALSCRQEAARSERPLLTLGIHVNCPYGLAG